MEIKVDKAKAYYYGGKTKVKIELTLSDYEEKFNDIKFINRKMKYNEWIYKHLINFAPWDYGFNIDLFSDSLKATGENILQNGSHVNNVKDGRRCLYAAHLLRTSYNESMYNDKALDYRHNRESLSWKPIGKGYSQLCTQYLTSNLMGMDQEEYSSKMSNIAYKRCREQDERRWNYAWDHIKRYLRHYWD